MKFFPRHGAVHPQDYPVDDTSDIRTGSGASDGRGAASGGLRGLDVIAKARQRIREVKERERCALWQR